MKTNKKEQFDWIDENGAKQILTADSVCATLSVNSVILENGQMICCSNLRLKPYAKVDGKYIDSGLKERTDFITDLFNCNDDVALKCISGINDLIQEYVLAKNL